MPRAEMELAFDFPRLDFQVPVMSDLLKELQPYCHVPCQGTTVSLLCFLRPVPRSEPGAEYCGTDGHMEHGERCVH